MLRTDRVKTYNQGDTIAAAELNEIQDRVTDAAGELNDTQDELAGVVDQLEILLRPRMVNAIVGSGNWGNPNSDAVAATAPNQSWGVPVYIHAGELVHGATAYIHKADAGTLSFDVLVRDATMGLFDSIIAEVSATSSAEGLIQLTATFSAPVVLAESHVVYAKIRSAGSGDSVDAIRFDIVSPLPIPSE